MLVSSKISHNWTVGFLKKKDLTSFIMWHAHELDDMFKKKSFGKKKVFFCCYFLFLYDVLDFHVHVVRFLFWFFCIPIWVLSLNCVVTQMYITNIIFVRLQWGQSFCSSKATLSFFLIRMTLCIHLLKSSHVAALCLLWLVIHFLLSQEEVFGSVYIVWMFFSKKKKKKEKEKKCVWPVSLVCACLICCCCSEWEAATLFGSKECFPCLSPSASALAARSVYKTLSAIVLLHGTAAGVEETTTGPFTFSPFLTTLNHLSLR